MADLSEFDAHEDARRPRPKHPSGWEPGVDTEKGEIVIQGSEDGPGEWDDVIRQFQLDPAQWQVDSDSVHIRTWDLPSGDRAFYYKANFSPRRNGQRADIDELVAEIRRHRKRKAAPPTGEHAMVVCLADWQIGKRGSAYTQERALDLIDAVEDRIRELRRGGVDLGALYVAGLGDLFEGCDGNYAMQVYEVEHDRREQARIIRHLLKEALKRWSRLFEKVVVLCVPGNHGEHRRNGSAFTTFGDNDDVAVFEQVAEAFAENPDVYGHIRFSIPDDALTVTVDIAGTIVSFAHGHQARGGGSPEQKLLRWWKGMQHARHPVGDADILVSGHYHHLHVKEDGPRTWFQCPTLDSGSQWWEESGGAPSKAGTLTFVVGPDGWSRMAVL